MQEKKLIELEKLFLAFSDKTRLRLLALMADGEVPVGYLADTLGESQPKISRHLAYLRTLGLVSTRRDGKWVYYGIDIPEDADIARVFETTLGTILPDKTVGQDGGRLSNNYAKPHPYDRDQNELEIFLL